MIRAREMGQQDQRKWWAMAEMPSHNWVKAEFFFCLLNGSFSKSSSFLSEAEELALANAIVVFADLQITFGEATAFFSLFHCLVLPHVVPVVGSSRRKDQESTPDKASFSLVSNPRSR
jgi:hypothetical protein